MPQERKILQILFKTEPNGSTRDKISFYKHNG